MLLQSLGHENNVKSHAMYQLSTTKHSENILGGEKKGKIILEGRAQEHVFLFSSPCEKA